MHAADVALGASALLWAVRAPIEAPREPIAWGIALVNAAAGAMFLVRRPAERFCSLGDGALAIASVPLAGVALALAQPVAAWPLPAVVLFLTCALGATAGIASLGRSFGVLPALRGTVPSGLYRVVRHPIYAAEFGMVIACAIAARRTVAWLLVVAVVALVALRIGIEEKLLATSDSYRAYRKRVRWRLMPWLW